MCPRLLEHPVLPTSCKKANNEQQKILVLLYASYILKHFFLKTVLAFVVYYKNIQS